MVPSHFKGDLCVEDLSSLPSNPDFNSTDIGNGKNADYKNNLQIIRSRMCTWEVLKKAATLEEGLLMFLVSIEQTGGRITIYFAQ